MATGGYKCVQFQWTGGRSDTVLERVNYNLTGIVEAIVNSNTGWALDSDMGQTSSSWYYELTMTSSYKAAVKFIVHSASHTRLAIGYASVNAIPTTTIPNEDKLKGSSTSYCNLNGLFVSTCDTSVDFDISQTGKISLPEQATRWISSCLSTSATSSPGSFVNENQYTYTYNMIIRGGQIAFLFRSSNWTAGNYKGFAIGRLVGTLAHISDDDSECDLGCILLNGLTGGEASSANTTLINTENSYYSISSNNCFFRGDTAFDKAVMSYIDDSNTMVNVSISNTEQLGTDVANPEANTGGRWCPLQVYVTSTDPSLYGIVSGDGFKGYLDTDFIRGVTKAVYSRGQTFGTNSEFLYLGGGIAIGWDSTNTISLF